MPVVGVQTPAAHLGVQGEEANEADTRPPAAAKPCFRCSTATLGPGRRKGVTQGGRSGERCCRGHPPSAGDPRPPPGLEQALVGGPVAPHVHSVSLPGKPGGRSLACFPWAPPGVCPSARACPSATRPASQEAGSTADRRPGGAGPVGQTRSPRLPAEGGGGVPNTEDTGRESSRAPAGSRGRLRWALYCLQIQPPGSF